MALTNFTFGWTRQAHSSSAVTLNTSPNIQIQSLLQTTVSKILSRIDGRDSREAERSSEGCFSETQASRSRVALHQEGRASRTCRVIRLQTPGRDRRGRCDTPTFRLSKELEGGLVGKEGHLKRSDRFTYTAIPRKNTRRTMQRTRL